MKTWQLIAKAGNTIGLEKAVTATEAVRLWRERMSQQDSYFDKYYTFVTSDNKILFN